MSGAFDPYYKWLGIPPHEQPPDHYRLLGLARFEPDTDVIESAADRQMAHVRSYQSGKHSDASQRLLNEIAAARLCLLTSAKKAAYDIQLKAHSPNPASDRRTINSPSASDTHLGAAVPPPPAPPLAAPPAPETTTWEAANNLPVVEPLPPIATDMPAPSGKEFVPEPDSIPYLPSKAATKPASNPLPVFLALGGAAAVFFLLIVGGVAAMYLMSSSGEESVVVKPSPPLPPDIVQPTPPAPPIGPPVTPDPPKDPTPVAYVPPPTGPLRATENVNGIVTPGPPEKEPNEPAEPEPEEPVRSFFPEPPQDTRAQVPTEAERATPREQIAELFPAGKARTFQDKSDLAQQLLDTSRGSEDKPSAHYELLEQARQVASEAGHLRVAFEAAEKLAKVYRVDELALQCDSVAAAIDATTPVAARTESVKLAIDVAEELLAKDRFQEAAKLISDLQTLARKGSDRDQLDRINTLKQRGSDTYAAYRKAESAIESLKADPKNEVAARMAGTYFAFAQGDWQLGLPMLVAGDDEELKAIAEAEMQVPTESDEIKQLADRWRKLSTKSTGIEADHQRARAAMWYRRIASRLAGLSKVEVDGYLRDFGEISAQGGRPLRPIAKPTTDPPRPVVEETWPPIGKPIDLLAMIDTQKHVDHGEWGFFGEGSLVSKPSNLARLQVPFTPPGTYELELEAMRATGDEELAIGLIYRGQPCHVVIDGWDGAASGVTAASRGQNIVALKNSGQQLTNGKSAKIKCIVQSEGFVVQCNGREVLRYTGPPRWDAHNQGWRIPDATQLALGTNNSEYRFNSMILTPVSPGVLPPQPAPQPPPSSSGKAIDLLALVDPNQHAVNGRWRKAGDRLMTPMQQFARLQIPIHPPAEYDLELEVMRIGGYLDLCIGLIYQGKQCHLSIDRYRPPITELLVDSKSNQGKESVATYRGTGHLLARAQRAKIKCEVRSKYVRLLVNEKEVLRFQGDATWSGINENWTIPDDEALMIGCWSSVFQIYSMELTPVSGEATLASSGGSSSSSGGIANTSPTTVNLLPLVNPAEHVVSGSWRVARNGEDSYSLTTPRGTYSEIQIPYIPASEYDLQVEMAMGETDVDVEWKLPYGGSEFNCKINNDKTLVAGKKRNIRCEVRKSGIRIFLDGKLVAELPRDPTEPMNANSGPFRLISRNTSVNVTSVQLKEISGRGRKIP